MDAAGWREAKEILAEVLARPAADRERFLQTRCGDPELRREIAALVAEYEADPDFLERTDSAFSLDALSDASLVDEIQPGARIGPYVVLDRLGAGGMGQVFLGSDPRLHRKVALKCLISSAAGGDLRTKILREARAAARVSHPNIATVHDVLEQDGRAFLVMEYVEGESLAMRLRRGRLGVDDVVAIGRQLASALAAAHAKGIVHRDLKPANVQMTPDGSVKVLDFGVAQAFAAVTTVSAATTASLASETGRAQPGTPAYMSPEQLLGQRVDHRSDLFSLGLVLFEMATGRRPYSVAHASDALAALAKPLPRADVENPDVPRALADVIAKALAIDADQRYQSAAEVNDALAAVAATREATMTRVAGTRRGWPRRRTAIAIAAGVLALVAVIGAPVYRRWQATSRPTAAGHVIAVLPLENLSGDPSKAYLGAGVAETLSMALSKVRTLTVISRGEVQEAVSHTRQPRRLAGELDAAFLVDGSVQEAGDRLRITLRLERSDGDVIWSDAYEDSIAAVFALHRQMAADLVRELSGGASGASVDVAVPTTSVEALTAYWQGRTKLDQATTPADFDDAVGAFRRAIGLDPRFALAYAGLADAYWGQYLHASHDRTVAGNALDAATTALRLDPDQPEVRVALGTIYDGTGQAEAAAGELRKAIALQPSNDDAHRMLARVLARTGKNDEAIRELQQAIALRPGRAQNYVELGALYYHLRRSADAVAAWQRALELQPNDSRWHLNLGVAYVQAGDFQRASEELERATALAPTALGFTNLAGIYYRLGRFTDAVAACGRALALDPKLALAHYNLADAYTRVGRSADARHEYQAARDLWLDGLRVNDKDSLALARVGLVEAKLDMRESAAAREVAAVALAPSDPNIQYKSAVVAALAGRRDEALQALGRALALGLDAREARDDYDLRSLQGSPEFRTLVSGSNQEAR